MNTPGITRRRALALSAGAAAAPLVCGAREGQPEHVWKMVTSWPEGSPGPGVTAERLARRINLMSGGRIQVQLYASGELVSALEVLDAVAGGAAALGHTASFFWQGKVPPAAFFTAVPFGLTAGEHAAWVYHGGGQALWDELYAPLGVKPFMAGNTGMGMAGWFKRPLRDLEDIKGLKYRIPGLGGEVLRRLGAVPVSVAPAEVFTALQTGVVDGAEFLGPWIDMAFGFYKVAPYYYWPGFHEPNGTGECLIGLELWQQLPDDLREIVASACAAENAFALAETEWHNGRALEALVTEHGVEVQALPADFLAAARQHSAVVLEEFAAGSELERRIYESYEEGRQRAIGWSRVSRHEFLRARAGG